MHRAPLQIVAVASVVLVLPGCGGGGGGSAVATPTVSIKASAANVQSGGSVTLTWSSANATACTASGSWSGAQATSGSESQTVAATSSYTLTCTGVGGSGSGTATVTAWSAPQPLISADANAILTGNSVTLTWSAKNASTCAGGDALSGTLPTSGTQASAALTTTTVFSVSCGNPVFGAVTASVTVTVSTTFTATLAVQYQVPGPPVLNAAHTQFVPDWGHPLARPVPFVWVQMRDPSNSVAAQGFADANGMVSLGGLNPSVKYTPVILSAIQNAPLGLDFAVLNNTTPTDTSQPTYRARYPVYGVGPSTPYTPGLRLAVQSLGTATIPDGWSTSSNTLVDANRLAAPFALLANAVFEAQIVSSAVGGTPTWRPLSILWSTRNKGGLSAPPNEMDQGLVTGSGGYYNSGHRGVDASGNETGTPFAEDLEFISGDQSFEPMDLYPFVLTHEMGHFTQTLFSTRSSPGGDHSYSDFEDPTQAWIEGNASGIAALVLNTPQQNRVVQVSGQLVVVIEDPANYTINGNPQSWPLGWYQEATVTRLMWAMFDPGGAVKLSAPTVLAPMYTPAWKAGPWLNTPWAYSVQLAKLNAGSATAIASLADSLNIRTTGDDEWGSVESNAGERTTQDALPPYTTVTLGAPAATICSAGAPNDYNKESNVRYFRILGDGNSHTLTIQGPSGSVPLLNRHSFTAGASTFTTSGSLAPGYTTLAVGDCAVSLSEFSTDTAACNEPVSPGAEQCWSVSAQ